MTARRHAEERLAAWFATRGWKPLPFQREVWTHYRRGTSGLLHTPTGSGKTLAAWGGPLLEALEESIRAAGRPDAPSTKPSATPKTGSRSAPGGRLRALWITPLRALAADTTRALQQPLTELGLSWQVAMRTGDASARDKRLARTGGAEVLVITPESLSLLLSDAASAQQLASVRAIVVDEWHELLGNKRGVLLQLALARLRQLASAHAPAHTLRIWGLSATLGNLPQARDVLLPHAPDAVLVGGVAPRRVAIHSLMPAEQRRLPWAGHMGLAQLPEVYARLQQGNTNLLFTNTRAQAELWHQALSAIWLDSPGTLALHHGSLDPALRTAAEQGLREGTVRCVVATSSLDLGVDFPAVDQVLQIGSPKGVARLMQRAGRARHRPGEAGELTAVPAQALDLLEFAAARSALLASRIESRQPLRLCLDVLAQHAVTLALGGGFEPAALLAEVRGTHAYADLSTEDWQAVLNFVVQGGQALENYPEYHRVVADAEGIHRVEDRRIALRHRLSIGTIAADGALAVRMLRGAALGTIEEGFIARLQRGDVFQFAGRRLELVRTEGMTAYVRKARPQASSGPVATWQGGRMPLSSELAHETETLLGQHAQDSGTAARRHPELAALASLLALQRELSGLPTPGRLLVEFIATRRGQHLFVYPFAGRSAHEGIAALAAWRWSQLTPNTWSYTVNDYGFMLTPEVPLSDTGAATLQTLIRQILASDGIEDGLRHALNLGELARRQFREVARVAGLLPPSLPGRAPPSMRQLQASAGLLYDVLRRYDPGHLLLAQAEREVLEQQLELDRLQAALTDCSARELTVMFPPSLTPLAFSLWAESLRGQFSNEAWHVRVRRAADQLEAKNTPSKRPRP